MEVNYRMTLLEKSQSVSAQFPLIQALPGFHYPVDDLRKDLDTALSRTPFDKTNQLNLTSLTDTDQNPYDYAGSLYDYSKSGFIHHESDFKYFVQSYKDLIFFRIYQDLLRFLPFPIGRMRLLKLPPRSCYTMHRDNGLRFHLAITTSPHSFIVYKEHGAYSVPVDGKVYCTNTLKDHTAINGSIDEDRIHLVLSTEWTESSGKLFSDTLNEIR